MNNELKEMLQSVLKEAIGPIKHELQGVKSEMNSRFDTIDTKMSSVEAKMDQGFEEVKDKLRVIEDQTARTSELQSPIYDLQQQVKDHDADIKLIKRVLTN